MADAGAAEIIADQQRCMHRLGGHWRGTQDLVSRERCERVAKTDNLAQHFVCDIQKGWRGYEYGAVTF